MKEFTINDLEFLGPKNQELGIKILRHPVLLAYDIYRINVLYGDIIETEEEHMEILSWAKRARDKDTDALKNIPEKIKHYIQKK